MELKGLIVTKIAKEEIVFRIDRLSSKYDSRKIQGVSLELALFRVYCRDVVSLLDECFETEMLAMSRFVSHIKETSRKDDYHLISVLSWEIHAKLAWLRSHVENIIPFEKLPSCKHILDLSIEDAVSVANDFNKDDILKSFISILSLGKKVGDIVTIVDLKNYYENLKSQLLSEIAEKQGRTCWIEQRLLEKFEAEIGYCILAMIKTGIGATKEILGLEDTARRILEKNKKISYGTLSVLQ